MQYLNIFETTAQRKIFLHWEVNFLQYELCGTAKTEKSGFADMPSPSGFSIRQQSLYLTNFYSDNYQDAMQGCNANAGNC